LGVALGALSRVQKNLPALRTCVRCSVREAHGWLEAREAGAGGKGWSGALGGKRGDAPTPGPRPSRSGAASLLPKPRERAEICRALCVGCTIVREGERHEYGTSRSHATPAAVRVRSEGEQRGEQRRGWQGAAAMRLRVCLCAPSGPSGRSCDRDPQFGGDGLERVEHLREARSQLGLVLPAALHELEECGRARAVARQLGPR